MIQRISLHSTLSRYLSFKMSIQMRLNATQGLVITLEAAHHQGPFEGRDDQHGHRLRINVGARFAACVGLLHDGLQSTKPGSKSFRDARSKDGIAVIGVNRSI